MNARTSARVALTRRRRQRQGAAAGDADAVSRTAMSSAANGRTKWDEPDGIGQGSCTQRWYHRDAFHRQRAAQPRDLAIRERGGPTGPWSAPRAMIYPLFRPLLFALDPETAHEMTFAGLDLAARCGAAQRVQPAPRRLRRSPRWDFSFRTGSASRPGSTRTPRISTASPRSDSVSSNAER